MLTTTSPCHLIVLGSRNKPVTNGSNQSDTLEIGITVSFELFTVKSQERLYLLSVKINFPVLNQPFWDENPLYQSSIAGELFVLSLV